MIGTKDSDRRHRGRPRLRPDEQTRQLIYLAALCEFEASGYAATTMESVARRAGISTKTLYRICTANAPTAGVEPQNRGQSTILQNRGQSTILDHGYHCAPRVPLAILP